VQLLWLIQVLVVTVRPCSVTSPLMSQLDCCPLRAKKDANPLETVKRIKTNKNEV